MIKEKIDKYTNLELRSGLRVQLWLQPSARFGAVLQFVTASTLDRARKPRPSTGLGSLASHYVRLRELAQTQGRLLSEPRLLRADSKEIECASDGAQRMIA